MLSAITLFYMLLVLIGMGLFVYVLINRLNQRDDFEDREN